MTVSSAARTEPKNLCPNEPPENEESVMQIKRQKRKTKGVKAAA